MGTLSAGTQNPFHGVGKFYDFWQKSPFLSTNDTSVIKEIRLRNLILASRL